MYILERTTPPNLGISDGYTPAAAVYGRSETRARYLPLVALVAQLPALKTFLPEHCQCLPMVNVIFADCDDRLLEMLVDFLSTGETVGNQGECKELMKLLLDMGVDLTRINDEEFVKVKAEAKIKEKTVGNLEQKLHNKEKEENPHECPVCGKNLKNSILLTKHLKKFHKDSAEIEGIRKLCNERLKNKEKKKKEKNHICYICGKEFPNSSRLRNHLSTSHGNAKKITDMKNLYEQYVDENGFKWVCKICGKKISSSKGIVLHIGSTHKTVNQLMLETGPEPGGADSEDQTGTLEPAEALDQTGTLEPAEVLDQTGPLEPAEAVDQTGTLEPAEGVDQLLTPPPVDQTGTMEPAEAVDQTGTLEPAEPVDQTGTLEPAESVDQTGTLEPAEGVDQTGTLEPAESVDQAGTLEPAQAVEQTGTLEPAEGVDQLPTPPPTVKPKTPPVNTPSLSTIAPLVNTPPISTTAQPVNTTAPPVGSSSQSQVAATSGHAVSVIRKVPVTQSAAKAPVSGVEAESARSEPNIQVSAALERLKAITGLTVKKH